MRKKVSSGYLPNSITQEEPLGCAVSCVAFLTNVDYKTAKKRYFKDIGDPITKGYLCRDVIMALSLAGMQYQYKRIKSRRNFSKGTIVFIQNSKKYPMGHYLVKADKGWMNSWINFPNVVNAKSGFENRLPGKSTYAIYPKSNASLSSL